MKKLFIIAEIAQGYEGDSKLVEFYVRAAAAAGADAVKFQIFYADELALPDYKYYKLFKSLELPLEVWREAVKRSHQKGMEFYSDVFGILSFRDLEFIGADGYKVHTTDINNVRLLKAVAGSGKRVFLSTGGCRLDEIRAALEILNRCEVVLTYGFQAEPTELGDNNLSRIRTLKKIFNIPVGFQDHTAGDSPFSFYLPFIAIGAGATVIEKHLTLSRRAELEDYISALTAEEFAEWSDRMKGAYSSLGSEQWELTGKEWSYRKKVRRAVCSCRRITKGKTIKETELILKRTNSKNAFFDISEVAGKRAKRNIEGNSAVGKEDIL